MLFKKSSQDCPGLKPISVGHRLHFRSHTLYRTSVKCMTLHFTEVTCEPPSRSNCCSVQWFLPSTLVLFYFSSSYLRETCFPLPSDLHEFWPRSSKTDFYSPNSSHWLSIMDMETIQNPFMRSWKEIWTLWEEDFSSLLSCSIGASRILANWMKGLRCPLIAANCDNRGLFCMRCLVQWDLPYVKPKKDHA